MKMTGAQILVETLVEQGVDTVFGYPGGQVLNIYDALYENRNRIRHILTSHEQGSVHAADGYSRATGKVGVCIATSGPGATNLVTGIATAYMDSIPMVAITGNVSLPLIGRDSFQEVDIIGITMPITKHNFFVKHVEELADMIRKAFMIARSGRPGPVLVDIPKDITVNLAEFFHGEENPVFGQKPTPAQDVDEAVSMIQSSEKPLLYCGGGVVFSDASDKLKKLIEKIDSPVALSLMGLSALSKDYPLNLGMIGMHGTPVANKASTQCDLLITLGARFSDRVVGNPATFSPNAKILHIDIDGSEHGKNVRCDHTVIADANEILDILYERLEPQKHTEWNQFLSQYKKEHSLSGKGTNGKLTMTEVVKTASSLLGDDAIIVTDVGQHQMITAQNYDFKSPRSFLSSGGLGTMGYGMGAAIGAKIGRPERTVALMTGDGSFHMNMNELACAVTENLPIIVIIFNNSVLGMVRQWQRLFYKERYSGTTLDRKTDFVKLAQAFGAEGIRIEDIGQLKDGIENAKENNTPTILECIIDKDDSVFPIIPPGKSANEIILSESSL